MPASKTATLEARVKKLEQELAAYKRQLQKGEPNANAGPRQLAELRNQVTAFFRVADEHGIRFWSFHPDVDAAASLLRSAVTIPDPDPNPMKRRPQ